MADGMNSFYQALIANNPYRQAAAPISAIQINPQFSKNPYLDWGLGETLGATAAQSFASALLNNLGARSESQQLEKIAQVLPGLKNDPINTNVPEGVDPEAFALLKVDAVNKNYEKKQDWLNKLSEIDLEGLKKKAITKAEIEGKKEAYGTNIDPEAPKEQIVPKLRDEVYKNKAVEDFSYVVSKRDQLMNIIKNPGAVSDSALSKIAVQIIEPRMNVNDRETGALSEATSLPKAWVGQIGKAIRGESALAPEIKTQLIQLANDSYNALGNNYQKVYNQFKNEAKRFQIDPDRILAFGEFQPIMPEQKTSSQSPSTSIDSSLDLKSKLQIIANKLEDPNLTQEQKTELVALAEDLTKPRGASGGW